MVGLHHATRGECPADSIPVILGRRRSTGYPEKNSCAGSESRSEALTGFIGNIFQRPILFVVLTMDG